MTLLLVHAAATWFMVGLIWFVQVVHYPLFARVAEPGSREYAAAHQRQTGWVVGPPMLAEAATTLLLLLRAPTSPLAWTGAALLAVVWLSTALLQVPRHARLALGHDPATVRSLVLGNWIRTVAWTARGVVAMYLLTA